MKSMKGTLKICSRGHRFYKSSDCPVCPICWKGFYKKKAQSDFPEKLGAPALRGLSNAGVKSLKDLGKHTEEKVMDIHGMGPKAMGMLKSAMKKAGVKFKKP